jgi:putative oxidoreductase
MHTRTDYAALVGRIVLASMFFLSGFGKIGAFQDTAVYMASAGFPTADLPLRTLVTFTILVELSGATAIILGWKTRSAAVAVFLFTAAATLLFHRFWDAAPGDAMVQQLMFMKNVSVMGGLLVLFAHGAGRYALDDAEDSSVDGTYWRRPGMVPATATSGSE